MSTSSSPSLKIMERQKRRGNPGGQSYSSQLNANSRGGLDRQSESNGKPRTVRNVYGIDASPQAPLVGEYASQRAQSSAPRSAQSGLRRSDTAGSTTSDFSFTSSRDPFRSAGEPGNNSSFLDASFVSAGKLNPDGGSYLRPGSTHVDPYGRDLTFRSEHREPSSLRSELYGREFAAASERSEAGVPSLGSVTPLENKRLSDPIRQASERSFDAYGRELPRRANPDSVSSTAETTSANRARNLAAWTRPALEARVETLERLLAEQQSGNGSTGRGGEDRELSEHLQVTVRKNRELRAELEVTKNRLATLLEEREAFAQKLDRDNESLQTLLEEAQRAKEALGNCIKQLSAEKADMAHRLALAEDEIIRLKALTTSTGSTTHAMIQFDEIRGNIEDAALINEGLKESLRQMQLKNPSFGTTALGTDVQQ